MQASRQGRFYVGAGGGGHSPPPPQMLATPQIFWFQQQKYAFLKSGLFFTVAKSTLVSVRA